MSTEALRRLNIASRFAGALVGGYVFAFGFVAVCSLAGFGAGLGFSESQTLAWMLGFLVYLAAMLWAFTPRSNVTVWAVLGGGGVVMSAAAWRLSRIVSS